MSTKTITMQQSIREWSWFILPPHADKCQICAVEHKEREPHDATTLFYWMYMVNVVGRQPTWAEAMQHCADDIKEQWTKALNERGIDINSTNVRGK